MKQIFNREEFLRKKTYYVIRKSDPSFNYVRTGHKLKKNYNMDCIFYSYEVYELKREEVNKMKLISKLRK